ncbi:hypothetical protein ACFPRL_06200 [Pseudoclavibacter helvolus]
MPPRSALTGCLTPSMMTVAGTLPAETRAKLRHPRTTDSRRLRRRSRERLNLRRLPGGAMWTRASARTHVVVPYPVYGSRTVR